MPRKKSYETERRQRAHKVRHYQEELKRLASNDNSYRIDPLPKELAHLVAEHHTLVFTALQNYFSALVDLNYLEWQVRGAHDEDD